MSEHQSALDLSPGPALPAVLSKEPTICAAGVLPVTLRLFRQRILMRIGDTVARVCHVRPGAFFQLPPSPGGRAVWLICAAIARIQAYSS